MVRLNADHVTATIMHNLTQMMLIPEDSSHMEDDNMLSAI
jgi:hypothetical protein